MSEKKPWVGPDRAHPPETEALVEALREIADSPMPNMTGEEAHDHYTARARRALEAYEGGQSDEG